MHPKTGIRRFVMSNSCLVFHFHAVFSKVTKPVGVVEVDLKSKTEQSIKNVNKSEIELCKNKNKTEVSQSIPFDNK